MYRHVVQFNIFELQSKFNALLYKSFIKPFLFQFTPEKAHSITLSIFRYFLAIPFLKSIVRNYFSINDNQLERAVMGLKFKNPIGLAAGFDKDGKYVDLMESIGFGFIELGTVTPKPQIGNPKPRLFRLPKDSALINRMGFNNDGVDALVERLKKGKPEGIVIGGNIGKNKITPNEQAVDDYAYCFEQLYPWVDYFVVNVSSPNTPGLRELQEKEPLTQLLKYLQDLNQKKANPKPILLKIAPDLSFEQLDDILEIIQTTQLAGIIATNTTISRAKLSTSETTITEIGNGGLSGQPLTSRSTEIIRYLHEKSKGTLLIIGVGGIQSPNDALEKLDAGATLVQIYTGLIYEGPSLVKKINRALVNTL